MENITFYVNSIFSLHEKRNKKQFFPKLNFIEQFVWQRCRGDTKLRQTRKIDIYFCWRCDEFVLLNYWEKIHCEALFIFNSIFDNFDWNWIIYREFVETFLSTFYRVAQEVAAQMSAAKSSPSRAVSVCRGLVCLLAARNNLKINFHIDTPHTRSWRKELAAVSEHISFSFGTKNEHFTQYAI